MVAVPVPRFARFDSFRLDLNGSQLTRAGQVVPLQELPLQVLRLLVLADGAVVTRETLCGVLWPKGTFVDFEHGLNTAVKKLRQALDDSAEKPNFIGTLPKIGYRFLAPLVWESGETSLSSNHSVLSTEHVSDLPQPTDVATSGRRRSPTPLMAGGFLILLAMLLGAWVMGRHATGASTANFLGHSALVPTPHGHSRSTLRRLTANPNDAPLTAGLLSPDGRYLAYSDITGIYLRHVDTGETFRLHLPQGFEGMPANWFPDSTHLLLSRFEDAVKKPPSLWEISILGGTARRVVEAGFSAAVARDGRTIAYLEGPWDAQSIWLADTDMNTSRKFAEAGEGSAFGAVSWAPDGHHFVTVRATHTAGSERTERRIEVFDLADAQPKLILSDSQVGMHVLWLASGRLIYSRPEPPPNREDWNLWSVQLDAAGNHSLNTPTRITNGSGSIESFSATADETRMAVLRRSTQSDVYLSSISATSQLLSKPRRLTLDERQDYPGSWTRDSRNVLFTSNRDGPVHIFKQDATQTQPQLLIGGKTDLFLPRLSPDGTMVLYLAGSAPSETSGNTHLFRVPLSGGIPSSLLEGVGIVNFQCARSPSTVCLYGQEDRATYRFFLFNAIDGSRSELIGARRRHEDGPNSWALSPSGRYLVSSRSQDPYKPSVLQLLDIAKGTTRNLLVPEVKLIVGLDFAADSSKIWVSGFLGRGARETRSGLFAVDLNGNSKKIFEEPNVTVFSSIPSPNHRSLALGVETSTSNVWLLEAF